MPPYELIGCTNRLHDIVARGDCPTRAVMFGMAKSSGRAPVAARPKAKARLPSGAAILLLCHNEPRLRMDIIEL